MPCSLSMRLEQMCNSVDVNSGTQSNAIPCNTKTNGKADINTLRLAAGSALTDIIHDCHLTIS